MEVFERVRAVTDLTPALLQGVLRRSLASPGLTVTGVRDPEELGGNKRNYGSDLRKLVISVEEEGVTREVHVVAKTALQSWITLANVWFNWFIFYREAFWFTTALPELCKLVGDEQATALASVMPKVHLAYCNYQEDNMASCFITKAKEKGVILMENLVNDEYVDMKEYSERMATISKKRKFVADGVFKAELNEFLTRELAEDGYSGVEVRVAPTKTEIIIMATRTQNVLGEKGRRIRELTSVVQKRFNFPENSVDLYAEKVATRGLCAIAQAESLRYKLIGGLAVRRACYGVLRFIMESGAKGCEVVVSGKLRGQRAKSMKFVDGLMIHSGDPCNDYVDTACRHVLLRQGVLGIKVKIMLPHDPAGKTGPKRPLPDHVSIVEPKEERLPATPYSESKGNKPDAGLVA